MHTPYPAPTDIAEAEHAAPLADAMMHVVTLHSDHLGRHPELTLVGITNLFDASLRALHAMNGGGADVYVADIPYRYAEVLESGLHLAALAQRYLRTAQTAVAGEWTANKHREAQHQRDLAANCIAEARHHVRHVLTLEGDDL